MPRDLEAEQALLKHGGFKPLPLYRIHYSKQDDPKKPSIKIWEYVAADDLMDALVLANSKADKLHAQVRSVVQCYTEVVKT